MSTPETYALSTAQAASKLGISRQSVARLIQQGKLDAWRATPRGRWLVSESSVSEYMSKDRSPGRPKRRKDGYVLMNKNHPVAVVEYDKERDVSFSVNEVIDVARCPLYVIVSPDDHGPSVLFDEWWKNRNIPRERYALEKKLRLLGLEDPDSLPFASLGLSLSDQYWLCPENSNIEWEDVTFFDNEFETGGFGDAWSSEWTWGLGSHSPDNALNGYLPKKWVCKGDERLLLKGSVENNDQPPFNEVVATAMYSRFLDEGDYVPYHLEMVGDDVASACPTFVSSDEEFISMWQLVNRVRLRGDDNLDAYGKVLSRYEKMGISRKDAERVLSKMIVCDFLLANTDRHLNNFGMIRNVDTLECRIAPIFDSGNSLWMMASRFALEHGNYGFTSKPFSQYPDRQLEYVRDISWMELSALDGFPEEAAGILAGSEAASSKAELIAAALEYQIAYLKDLFY